jgi:hypothetical protein
MKHLFFILGFLGLSAQAQENSSIILNTGDNDLVSTLPDGRYTLNNEGASYFAQLSLACVSKSEPHFFYKAIQKEGDTIGPKDLWPSFYGCYDWHSGVHNHWCMIKLLKKYPNIPEASALRKRLNESFTSENIQSELIYVSSNENGLFEFPYGQAWILKVADELATWEDPDAKIWLQNLSPLSNYIAAVNGIVWKSVNRVALSGSHDSPAMALSFAYDYSLSFHDDKLKKVVADAALKYYNKIQNVPIADEPFKYDFMSASLLVADLMRKVKTPEKFVKWSQKYCPDLFIANRVNIPLQIKKSEKHDGYESHWDGYHLNRIWCLNGMLKTLPEGTLDEATKKEWTRSMNEMWDYAQQSIGVGNYDIDHWLSTFSVFALIGYE